jgi:hypothetical protein
MAILTVGTPGGGVETFLDVNLEGTVGAFKAVVGMRVRMQQFRLHAKLPTGTIPLKIADDSARLSEVGLKDGGELRLDKLFRFNGPQQAQRRLDKGLTNVAHSLKNGFKEVGGKVDGVEVKVDGVQETVGKVDRKADEIKSDTAKILGELKDLKERKAIEVVPGEMALMSRVIETLSVGKINILLYRWGIPRDQHLKKAGKAKLLVTEARREDLERVLADPSVAEELKETEAAAVAVVTAAGAKERPKREKKGKKEKKEKKEVKDSPLKQAKLDAAPASSAKDAELKRMRGVHNLQNDSSPKQAKLDVTPASSSSAGEVVTEQLAAAFEATTEEEFNLLLGSTTGGVAGCIDAFDSAGIVRQE